MSDEQPPIDVPAPAADEETSPELQAPVPDEPAPEAEAAPAAPDPVLPPSADLINALAAAASAGAAPSVESAPLYPVDLQNRPIPDANGYQGTTPLPHGGRPIPKQTAAGALLTGPLPAHDPSLLPANPTPLSRVYRRLQHVQGG